MSTSIVTFEDIGAVQAFAGDHPEVAVVEETARRALLRWDDHVVHRETAARLPLL